MRKVDRVFFSRMAKGKLRLSVFVTFAIFLHSKVLSQIRIQFLVICNLVGHKSNVSCSEFHTHSEYLASGSVDSHVRLWDLRRKGCIYTYKGHNGAINSLKFSPDSKWIASASEDCSIKVNFRKRGDFLNYLLDFRFGILKLVNC